MQNRTSGQCLVAVVGVLILSGGAIHAQEAGGNGVGDIHDVSDGITASATAGLSIVGVRNGAFSGKYVVGGSVTKAVATDLRQGSSVIPAANITIRYAAPTAGPRRGPSHISPQGNDLLLEVPPVGASGKRPIWVTVKVPKDAKPGVYTGQLTAGSGSVPIKLDVRDWTLSDPQNYRLWMELVESPDTLALEYNVPLWSEKHWELIAKSLRLIADTGSRVIYIPLVARTNYGNAESMVRWIKKGEGKYEYDFSIVEKYLDVVEKNLGTPKISVIYAWESYLLISKNTKPIELKGDEGAHEKHLVEIQKAQLSVQGKGPPVTVWDPATQKTENFYLPRYEDPASKAFWKPVWAGVRQRLAKHGWEKSMMVGNSSDLWPSKEEVAALNELSGGLPWTDCSHNLTTIRTGVTLGKVQGLVDWGYAATALEWQFNFNPAKGGHHYGWKLPELNVQYWRFQKFNAVPAYDSYVGVRHAAECLITANKRGLGHIGADFWPCIKNKKGSEYDTTVTDRFPESYWRSLHIMAWMLGPGPDGPVGTGRLELMREGVQECEARIAIERALSDDALKAKLGGDLAKRAQDYLDERLVTIWKGLGITESDMQIGYMSYYRQWYEGIGKRADLNGGLKTYLASGWQAREAKLFDLAGEVEGKLGGK